MPDGVKAVAGHMVSFDMNMTWLMGSPSAETHLPSRLSPSAYRRSEDGGTEGERLFMAEPSHK